MSRPKTTLGISIAHPGAKIGGSGMAIGWALFADVGIGRHAKGTYPFTEGDPAEQALRLARRKKVTDVTLTRYLNDSALMRSEHARTSTLVEHNALVERTRDLLEAHGITVTIEVKS